LASIERTAYPRFRRTPTARELEEAYTPTAAERQFLEATTRGEGSRFTLAVMLKAFQRLGYFPRLRDVPAAIVQHLRTSLAVAPELLPGYDSPRTQYRHQHAIRAFLDVTSYGRQARHAAVAAVFQTSQVMDNPADLINAVIEALVKERYELPAFSALDRLVRRVRTLVNRRVFEQIAGRLSATEATRLDQLLEASNSRRRSAFSALKETPKNPTLTHMREWQAHLLWLLSLGDADRLLAGIPTAKIVHIAAEARAADADALKDVTVPKRRTLLLCLIQRARVAARDGLADMFVKRIGRLHVQGKEALAAVHERQRETTERLLAIFTDLLHTTEGAAEDAALGRQVRDLLAAQGGAGALLLDCEALAAYRGNNYLPLLWPFYRSHRRALFRLVRSLEVRSTTRDSTLLDALAFVLTHEHARREWLPDEISLAFASEQWQRTVRVRRGRRWQLARRHLEVCVFSSIAAELKTGDLCVLGSEAYADYRDQLLAWETCAPRVADYCQQLGFPASAGGFVEQLKAWLAETAERVDRTYPENDHLTISASGEPTLGRLPRAEPLQSVTSLEAALAQRLPERDLLDILCRVQHWTSFARHFGPPSGADPKLDQATERYLLTTFGMGCNLGPYQTARHTRGAVSPHMLSFVDQRHVTARKLDAALRDIINTYARFDLPRRWGSGKTAAADGTKFDLYEENLLSEYHIRYGGYGGIAYHHVSDTYIALFSHFISCGTWEAIYIIDGLLKNSSEIQPDTVHADTQGQSTPVFAFAHLLGIKLMPRIRNWKDLVFYRPDPASHYTHLDALFTDVIDWKVLETHWQDLLQVVLSIKAGTVLPSTLLRKLGNYSRKNRLYQAFRELGRVVRTVFLLEYLSSPALRIQVTATTNKVESYHALSKWCRFGGEGVIRENDPDEQEKQIKYTDVVTNAVILQNAVDMSYALRDLVREGHAVTREAVAGLSPYFTRHIKRFGDYVVDLSAIPQPLEEELSLPI